jgi:hypothetical protein
VPAFLLGALDFRQWLGLQTVSQPSSVTSRQGRSPDLGYVDFHMTKH